MKKLITSTILTVLMGLTLAVPLCGAVYGIEHGPENAPFKELFQYGEEMKNVEGAEGDLATAGIVSILDTIIDGLLYIAAPVAIVFIAFTGTSYIMALGKQEGLDTAKKSLIWAILGLVLIIMSYALVRLIIAILTDIPAPVV